MQQAVSLTQILFGQYVPPPVASVRRHSLMSEEPVTVRPKRPKIEGMSKRDRLLAVGKDTRNRIRVAMGAMAGFTMEEIATEVCMSRTAVQNHILALLKEGHVRREHRNMPTGGYNYVYYPVKQEG